MRKVLILGLTLVLVTSLAGACADQESATHPPQVKTPSTQEFPVTWNRIGVVAHWHRWIEGLTDYQEKIKAFGICRDQAWWRGLERGDLVESDWDATANWDYKRSEEIPCGQEKMKYDSGYDNLVKLYQDDDSPDLLLLLSVKNDTIAPIEDITPDQYYDYVYHVVERYDGDGVDDMPNLERPVVYFEMGNEVDIKRDEDKKGVNHGYMSPKDYVTKRLIPGYLGAKDANPDCVVMNAGLNMEHDAKGHYQGGFTTAYLDEMYRVIKEHDGANNNYYMDKVAIHYYSQCQNPEYIEDNEGNISSVKDLIRSYEGKDKPIWVTEVGFPTGEVWGCIHSEEDQAGILIRYLSLMFYHDVEKFLIYNLKDDILAGEYFGLYEASCQKNAETVQPKKSAEAIIVMMELLAGLKPDQKNVVNVSQKGKTYEVGFSGPDKKMTIIWYTEMDGTGSKGGERLNDEQLEEMAATVSSLNVRLIDMEGNVSFPRVSNSTVILREIGERPKYLVEDLLPQPTPQVVRGGDWPMYGHDPGRTGYTPDTPPDELELIWQYDFSPFLGGWPAMVVGDSKVFIADHGRVISQEPMKMVFTGQTIIYCFDVNSGSLIWKNNLEGDCVSQKCLAEAQGKLFLATTDWAGSQEARPAVYCLDANTGQLVWKDEGNHCISDILVSGGKVFSAGYDFRCLDVTTGHVIWSAEHPCGQFITMDGNKLFSVRDSSLLCYNKDTGQLIWSREFDRHPAHVDSGDYRCVCSAAAAANNKVLVNCSYFCPDAHERDKINSLSCFDASTGKLLWWNDIGIGMRHWRRPVVAHGKVVVGHYYDDGYVITCLDVDSGQIEWQERDANPSGVSSYIVADEMVVMSGFHGHCPCYLNIGTGKLVKAYTSDFRFGYLVQAYGKLFSFAYDHIRCFGAKP